MQFFKVVASLSLLSALSACGPVAVDGLRPYGANIPTFQSTASSVSWSTDARTYRGMNGTRVRFDCPAMDGGGTLYGADLFTDDSSVCQAGQFAGRINTTGGVVVIEIRAGAASYASGTRNGITTNAYSAYDGSFVVL